MKPHSSPRLPQGRPDLAPAVQSLRALNSLASGVVVIAALYVGRGVLIPITLAVLLSFIAVPLVGLLRRFRFGRLPSVIVAVLFALSVLSAVGVLFELVDRAFAERDRLLLQPWCNRLQGERYA
ncbi:hypothetical protein PQR67_35530 [Paraburkholderia fungorum]|uniref:AI-2E family transporter n=1 Tax=Paraburkholderia fungorum TaxID=134537 RepID=UPI0038BBDCBA